MSNREQYSTTACEQLCGGVAERDKDEVWQVVERQ